MSMADAVNADMDNKPNAIPGPEPSAAGRAMRTLAAGQANKRNEIPTVNKLLLCDNEV